MLLTSLNNIFQPFKGFITLVNYASGSIFYALKIFSRFILRLVVLNSIITRFYKPLFRELPTEDKA